MTNQILLGACLDILKTLPDASVDAIVTDPPYGLGPREPEIDEIIAYLLGNSDLDTGGDFMGKDWHIPSVAVWRECYRVLKPGGHLLSFGGCYDAETEVLTKEGWRRFPDLKGDEEFASLDLISHKVVWQRAKELVRQPHLGPMFHYSTNKVDLLVTPNHKMFVATMGRRTNPFRLVRADQHGSAIRMTKTSAGRSDVTSVTHFTLPSVSKHLTQGRYVDVPALDIPLSVWLPFLGLYLAEGSTTVYKSKISGKEASYVVQICHFNEANINQLKRILQPYFHVLAYPEQGKIRINSKQLFLYLRQFGKAWEKYIPEDVKILPASDLGVLLDWYMRGDGDGRRGYTTSPRLRDDWQEVAMYMGISCDWVVARPKKKLPKIKGRTIYPRRPSYIMSFNHTQNRPEVYNRESKQHPVRREISAAVWGGKEVYCVELERHHTLYVRRNGKAVWCGNTRTFDLISIGIRAAGFENRDTVASEFGVTTLQWVYGQGFPKSLNISKAIDKLAGHTRKSDYTPNYKNTTHGEGWGGGHTTKEDPPITEEAKKWEGYGTALKPSWEPILVFRKPIEEKTVAEQVLKTGTGGLNIDSCRVTSEGPSPSIQIRKNCRRTGRVPINGKKAAESMAEGRINRRGSAEAYLAEHSGEKLGRWPANILFTHTDGCKIVGYKKVPAPVINRWKDGMKPFGDGAGHPFTSEQQGDADGMEEIPVYECADGCPVKMLDEQSGELKSSGMQSGQPRIKSELNRGYDGGLSGTATEHGYRRNSGGASRFFGQLQPDAPFLYCGKVSRKERDGWLVKIKPDVPFMQLREELSEEEKKFVLAEWPKHRGTSPENMLPQNFIPEELQKFFISVLSAVNMHPTMKPLALMEWLVKLVTPKDAVVLDPYCGTGTTCIAAIASGCKYIGIEKDPSSHELAGKRIAGLQSELDIRAEDESQRETFELLYELEQDV